jgi:glutathione synthase
MKALFVTDPLDTLDVSLDTSVGLMHAVQDQGCEVWVALARDLEVVAGAARAFAKPLKLAPSYPADGCRWTVPDPWYDAGPLDSVRLDDLSAVFMRTEPPLDLDYLAATYVLDLVGPGTAMVNDPRGLRACSEHLMALAFPSLVPPTVVTSRSSTIRSFLAEHGAVVLKPVDGFSGRGVFLLASGDPNLASIIETATGRGTSAVMAQPYLPAVREGNKRIFVVDGSAVGAALRYPVGGDFRIASPSAAAPLTDRDLDIVDTLRPVLRRHGLRAVGLDVIGDYLIEVNVTSTGALRKADALLGTSYCADLVTHVLSNQEWSSPS